MKKYDKHEAPLGYKVWFDENNQRLLDSDLKTEDIFDEKLTPKLRKSLQKSLLEEQGYICAYCGKRIGKISKSEKIPFSIDHFESKFCNRALVLAYLNFLGTCKMSEYRSIRVNLSEIKSTPKTYRNIALELDIDLEDFTGKGKYNADDDLEAEGILEVKYRTIPLHCDDAKEERLKNRGWKPELESVGDYVINPTTVDNCDLFFAYNRDGSIKVNTELSDNEKLKAEHSIAVFNLDNDYLRKDRVNAYIRAEELLDIYVNEAIKNKKEFSIEDIDEKIQDDIYSVDDDGKLDPYCFVTAYVFRAFL